MMKKKPIEKLIDFLPVEMDFKAMEIADLMYPESIKQDREGRLFNRGISAVVRMLRTMSGVLEVGDGWFWADRMVKDGQQPLKGSLAHLIREQKLLQERMKFNHRLLKEFNTQLRVHPTREVGKYIPTNLPEGEAGIKEVKIHQPVPYLKDTDHVLDVLLRYAEPYMQPRIVYDCEKLLSLLPVFVVSQYGYAVENMTGSFCKVNGRLDYSIKQSEDLPKKG